MAVLLDPIPKLPDYALRNILAATLELTHDGLKLRYGGFPLRTLFVIQIPARQIVLSSGIKTALATFCLLLVVALVLLNDIVKLGAFSGSPTVFWVPKNTNACFPVVADDCSIARINVVYVGVRISHLADLATGSPVSQFGTAM